MRIANSQNAPVKLVEKEVLCFWSELFLWSILCVWFCVVVSFRVEWGVFSACKWYGYESGGVLSYSLKSVLNARFWFAGTKCFAVEWELSLAWSCFSCTSELDCFWSFGKVVDMLNNNVFQICWVTMGKGKEDKSLLLRVSDKSFLFDYGDFLSMFFFWYKTYTISPILKLKIPIINLFDFLVPSMLFSSGASPSTTVFPSFLSLSLLWKKPLRLKNFRIQNSCATILNRDWFNCYFCFIPWRLSCLYFFGGVHHGIRGSVLK